MDWHVAGSVPLEEPRLSKGEIALACLGLMVEKSLPVGSETPKSLREIFCKSKLLQLFVSLCSYLLHDIK